MSDTTSTISKKAKRVILRRAFVDSIPVLMGYVTMGFAVGALMAAKADVVLSPLWAFLTSAIWVTGTMSIACVAEIAQRSSLLTFALLTLALNFRYAFYGYTFLKRWKDVPLFHKLYMILMLADENYVLMSAHREKNPAKHLLYCTYVSIMNHSYWVVGVTVGAVVVCALGHVVDPAIIRRYTNGMEFTMASLFLVILTEQARTMKK